MKILHCSAALCLALALTGLASAQLLVSDRTTNQITKYDPVTGEYQGVLVPGDPNLNGGLFMPSSMTLGPDGDLFVASQATGSVLRYDTETGIFLGSFAEQLNGPSGLYYDQDQDELLVSTFGNFDSELVLRFQGATGEMLSALGEGTGASGRSSLTQGPNGDLFVSSFANGQFFTGSVLQFDGQSQAPLGTFATTPFLAGASGLTFHQGATDDSYMLDVVGLFSGNVARFDVQTVEGQLQVASSEILIEDGLDFPTGLLALNDTQMLVTNLGNDNPQTGDLRPGSIKRFDIASGEFVDDFIVAGGEGNLQQPTSLLLLEPSCGGELTGDIDDNGEVGFADFLLLSSHFNQPATSAPAADLDCDGDIGFADFLILSANYGATASETAAVPEPAAGWLGTIAALMLLGVMRRRR